MLYRNDERSIVEEKLIQRIEELQSGNQLKQDI
jgi:hypothetical protein